MFNYMLFISHLFDVYVKSFLASHTWISPSIKGEGPEAREGHSAAVVGKRLYIFGGCGKSADNNNEVYYNDLYILNTGNFLSLIILWYCQSW